MIKTSASSSSSSSRRFLVGCHSTVTLQSGITRRHSAAQVNFNVDNGATTSSLPAHFCRLRNRQAHSAARVFPVFPVAKMQPLRRSKRNVDGTIKQYLNP